MELEFLGYFSVLLAMFLPFGMYKLSINNPPKWIPDGPLAPFWDKINLASFFSALFFASLGWYAYKDYTIYVQGTAILMTSLLGYLSLQMFYTDFWQRYADRRILRIANLTAGIFGFYFIWEIFEKEDLMLYLIFFVLASCLIYVPKLGASDGRALQLVVLTSFPLVGSIGLQYSLIGFVVFLTFFAIGNAFYYRDASTLVKKVSTPLVPIILIPNLMVILSHQLFL